MVAVPPGVRRHRLRGLPLPPQALPWAALVKREVVLSTEPRPGDFLPVDAYVKVGGEERWNMNPPLWFMHLDHPSEVAPV